MVILFLSEDLSMNRRAGYNPKRKLAPMDAETARLIEERLGRMVYTGNPEHKKYPNDYGLTPPASPRPGKTLCDEPAAIPKADAETLIGDGIKLGMVSVQRRNGWPQNIWAVREPSDVFEAQLENSEQGHYHGYPMPADDDFQAVVLAEWRRRKHDASI